MIFTVDQLFTIIILIVVVDYAINTIIDVLNLKKSSAKLPEDLKDIYEEEKYQKAIKYQRTNTKFGLLSGFSSVIIMFLVLYFGILGELDSWTRIYFDSVITQTLAFFGIVYIINDIWNIPWQWYAAFNIEEKFGFNKLTLALFWKDKLKSYLLTAIVGGILLSVLVLLILWLGQSFWWIFWLVIVLFMVGANFFYTSWILPLFNKLTPLEDGSLREKIMSYGKSVNFPIENIYIMDGSKRSSKANAFFSGFGKRKKIVLFDTLLDKHTDEELVAILAHEVGHYKKKHTISGLVSAVLQTGVMLLIMSYMIFNPYLSQALGAEQLSFPVNFIAFGIIYTPISMLLSLFSNFISRKHEFQADKFAANTYNGEELQNALKKLSIDSLSNLKPHKLYVIFHYSHPPLLQRLQAIDKHK
ncbi:M48 family metallopeptidase [Marivirga salinae]|uniref:M48 family metallopeptidase n=1 Tax=Marivirga salinarum TaxID=3059078 RepID=A0AA51NAU2_9BACT|nr:M48 family metallopeptidase [Marivirga sp. BDSF4-3]WMN11738.1 M48 family metallopeptidase [Marivirga sp. BDSF4-3]